MLAAQKATSVVLLCCLAFVPAGFTDEQPNDDSLRTRTLRQQMFAVEFMKAHPLATPFSTPEEIDAYFGQWTKEWSEHSNGKDAIVRRLGSYPYAWALYTLMKFEVPLWAHRHVYETYIVPAFLADFDHINQKVSAESAFIITSELTWVYNSRSFDCELSLPNWRRLKGALDRMPPLVDEYLAASAYEDDAVATQLRRVRDGILRIEPLLEVKDTLYASDHDVAFASLAAAFTHEVRADALRSLGEQLWQAYRAKGESTKALATLDLLAHGLTAATLPGDELSVRYAETDPQRGPRLYRRAADTRLSPLVSADDVADLSGAYENLGREEPFDLSTLKGELVLLDFWTTSCGPCVAEIPHLNALNADHGAELVLVSIACDGIGGEVTGADVQEFMKEQGIEYTVLFDDPQRSLMKRFGVTGWPTMFLIGKDGHIMNHPTESRKGVRTKEVKAYLEARR